MEIEEFIKYKEKFTKILINRGFDEKFAINQLKNYVNLIGIDNLNNPINDLNEYMIGYCKENKLGTWDTE
jgi:hypothetical protein